MADRMETMPVAETYESVDFANNIVLECYDEVACVLPKTLAKHLNKLAELFAGDENPEVKVPLSEIKSETVNKIFTFLKHHEQDWPPQLDIKRPLKLSLKETLHGTWDYDTYFQTVLLVGGDIKQNDAINLCLKACHELECEPLLNFCCAALADIVRGVKCEEDFRELFGLTEPFTQEETDKLYEDYEYRDTKK